MQSSILLYFAYGSNLHPLRLEERVHSARLLGVGTCQNRKLSFNKRSDDGSAKCNLIKAEHSATTVYGAIYQLKFEDKAALDRIEGKGFGYTDNQISVQHDNRETSCFTYIAQNSHIARALRPYHWYKELVILGARYLEFPNTYVNAIKDIESIQDPNSARNQLNVKLINRMARYQS